MWCLIVSIPDLCPLSYFAFTPYRYKIVMSENDKDHKLKKNEGKKVDNNYVYVQGTCTSADQQRFKKIAMKL